MILQFRETFNETLTRLGDTYEASGTRALAYVIHRSKKDKLYYVHYITGDGALKLGRERFLWHAIDLAQHFENTGSIKLPVALKRSVQ